MTPIWREDCLHRNLKNLQRIFRTSKSAGYKGNTQKSIILPNHVTLINENEQMET